jgi:hypothetical protein
MLYAANTLIFLLLTITWKTTDWINTFLKTIFAALLIANLVGCLISSGWIIKGG